MRMGEGKSDEGGGVEGRGEKEGDGEEGVKGGRKEKTR